MIGGRRIVVKGDVAFVGLGPDSSEMAAIDKADLDFLRALGCSLSWRLSPTGYVLTSARRAPGKWIGVSRCLLDAGPNEVVRHKDGDKRNLRRENLRLATGWARRRDRDYLRTPTSHA